MTELSCKKRRRKEDRKEGKKEERGTERTADLDEGAIASPLSPNVESKVLVPSNHHPHSALGLVPFRALVPLTTQPQQYSNWPRWQEERQGHR